MLSYLEAGQAKEGPGGMRAALLNSQRLSKHWQLNTKMWKLPGLFYILKTENIMQSSLIIGKLL